MWSQPPLLSRHSSMSGGDGGHVSRPGWDALPSGPHPHKEPANRGNPLGSDGHGGNVAAGFIWVHLGSRCVTLVTLRKARAPGLGSPWKLRKTFNFCRSQDPPEQSQQPGSLQEPRSWGKAPDQSLQSHAFGLGAAFGDWEQREERASQEGKPPPSKIAARQNKYFSTLVSLLAISFLP